MGRDGIDTGVDGASTTVYPRRAMRFMPEVAVKPRPDNEPGYVRSYVFTRFAIGLLGVLLPLVLVLLEPELFDGLPAPRG